MSYLHESKAFTKKKMGNHAESENTELNRIGPVRFILFWAGIPFAVVFMLGDILAAPLDKYRHNNIIFWLISIFLRMSVPIAIIIASLFLLIRKLT